MSIIKFNPSFLLDDPKPHDTTIKKYNSELQALFHKILQTECLVTIKLLWSKISEQISPIKISEQKAINRVFCRFLQTALYYSPRYGSQTDFRFEVTLKRAHISDESLLLNYKDYSLSPEEEVCVLETLLKAQPELWRVVFPSIPSSAIRYKLALAVISSAPSSIDDQIDHFGLNEEHLLLLLEHVALSKPNRAIYLINRLNIDKKTKLNVALLITTNRSCSFHLFVEVLLADFDEPERFQLTAALCTLFPRHVGKYISTFKLSAENMLLIAEKIGLTPSANLFKWSNRFLSYFNEAQRYAFVRILCIHFPNEVARDLLKFKLSVPSELKLLYQLAKNPRSHLPRWISNIDCLPYSKREELAFLCAHANPAVTYKYRKEFKLPNPLILKEPLAAYYQLARLLSNFETCGSRRTFKAILTIIEHLSKTSFLPQEFTTRLEELMEIKIQHLSPKRLKRWMTLINRHPSSMTLILTHKVHLRARTILPKIKHYFYVDEARTKVTGQALDIAARTLTLKPGCKIYQTTTLSHFTRSFRDFFLDSCIKKAAFPVNVSSNLQGHFTAVYAEKDILGKVRILISDSVGMEKDPHQLVISILYLLQDLPIQDIYIMHPQRQFSRAACSIFTLDDLYEALKIDHLFDVLDLEGDIKHVTYKEIPYKQVQAPPTGMFKMTQSISKIRTYMENTGSTYLIAPHLSLHHPSGTTLKAFIHAHTITVKREGLVKKQNNAAAWALAHLFHLILLKLDHLSPSTS